VNARSAAVDEAPIAAEQVRECWDLLSALHLLHAHLWLGRQGEPTNGLTVMLSVDHRAGSFLVDALRDAPDLAPGDALYFDTQVEGRRLRFECVLDRILPLNDGLAYRIIEPRLVLDQQRRHAYRVRVPASLRLPVAIRSGPKLTAARVLDLSTLGCSTRVESVGDLADGDAVRVSVRIGDTDLNCAARIRHVQRLPGAARLGMEFELDPQSDTHALDQAVAKLQREILRRRQV
jgi:hypothetical protein